jgi:SAM-dependent methyltransferase
MLLNIKRGSEILDVGCGGGRPVLAAIGRVTGLEPIDELRALAQEVYTEVAKGGAEKMPFPDNRFDAVVSTDILGHIPFAIKDAVISEMFRVLRPSGITVHVAEVDSDGWLMRIAKREPGPYRETCVEAPDHRAMEAAEPLLARFRRAGFVVEKVRPIQPIVPEWGTISNSLSKHRCLSGWLRVWRGLDRLVAGKEIVREIMNVALTPLAVVNLFAPVEAGLGITIVARKPAGGVESRGGEQQRNEKTKGGKKREGC